MQSYMSTKCRAWLLGAAVGIGSIGYINHRFIQNPQTDILLDLRKALMTPETNRKYIIEDEARVRPIPFFSRQTLNLVLIAISDRFIFDEESTGAKEEHRSK